MSDLDKRVVHELIIISTYCIWKLEENRGIMIHISHPP